MGCVHIAHESELEGELFYQETCRAHQTNYSTGHPSRAEKKNCSTKTPVEQRKTCATRASQMKEEGSLCQTCSRAKNIFRPLISQALANVSPNLLYRTTKSRVSTRASSTAKNCFTKPPLEPKNKFFTRAPSRAKSKHIVLPWPPLEQRGRIALPSILQSRKGGELLFQVFFIESRP